MAASEERKQAKAGPMYIDLSLSRPTPPSLAGMPVPAWIYSFRANAFRWANREGLRFWRYPDVPSLRAVDLSGTPQVTLARLHGLGERLRRGGPVTEAWPLCPGGVARTAACLLWAVDWDGEDCIAALALPTLLDGAEDELTRRDDILRAVAESAQRLLHGRSWIHEGNELLTTLGRAAKVDRSYFFRFRPADDAAGDRVWIARQEFEWCAPGVPPEIGNPQLQHLDMIADGFPRWIERFGRGQAVVAAGRDEMAASERGVLDPQGITAICVHPVSSDGELLGFVGFDIVGHPDGAPFGGWTAHTVDALATGAHLIAAALKMDRTQSRLAKALADAQAANRAKSEFLAAMSHELRTPLNAINGFSQMMEHQVFGPLGDARYGEYAHNIHASGEHLLALISDILEMSKIEAGSRTLHEVRLSVPETIEAALDLIRERAGNRILLVHTDQSPPLPGLWADERAVLQMLTNLLSNAVKFTPEGGRIIVSAHRDGAGGVMLAVSDTGVGILPEDRTMVMEPFRQGKAGRTQPDGGTGLGLSLAKSLIELHGGTIGLESEQGIGTTVTLRFPPERTRADAVAG